MIYVILGMHKSGTTLVSEILHHSGINMGEDIDDQVFYDGGNKYECKTVQALNRDILNTQPFVDGFSPLDLPAPDKLEMTSEQRIRMREYIQNRNRAHENWGFKDPRNCLTWPMWVSELPEHKIIAIYRPPEEIWPRFRWDGLRHFYTNPRRAWKLIHRWGEHNLNILSCLENTKSEFLVLSYQELVETAKEFERLQEFVGFDLKDQRRAKLYRNRSRNHPLLKIATWLAPRRTGYTPEHIMKQLEMLRHKH